MKSIVGILALAIALVQAHYVFPGLVYNGQTTTSWKYVRMVHERYNKGPVQNVQSTAIRCNEDANRGITETLTVAAGSTVGFTSESGISHPGPLQFYMAKVPAGLTAATWDGSGVAWFKIFGQGPIISNGNLQWPSLGVGQPSVKLPSSLPSGEYLIRVEHIALHGAYELGGAQFYLACGQLSVTGGGNGTPGPLVSFPGAYDATDPGLHMSIYSPINNYTLPGPRVWLG